MDSNSKLKQKLQLPLSRAQRNLSSLSPLLISEAELGEISERNSYFTRELLALCEAEETRVPARISANSLLPITKSRVQCTIRRNARVNQMALSHYSLHQAEQIYPHLFLHI